MKRFKFAWLLVLPYVVNASTWVHMMTGELEYKTEIMGHFNGRFASIECGNNEDACEDMAEALNAAHERRTDPTIKKSTRFKLIAQCRTSCIEAKIPIEECFKECPN